MSSAFFIAMRRLRTPLIILILIFSVSITGLVLIPGVDAEGHPWQMSFFHALYLMSYTASTIGFGEIPHAFTDAQRLWVTFCIFLSVIGWAYAIGKLLGVLQDRGFRQALLVERFERAVSRLHEPFYLVCGFGETGQLLCHALDRLRYRCVVLDQSAQRIEELELQDYRASLPGFAGDVRLPEHLRRAGVTHPQCLGVLAMTGDDAANLGVAIAARLLNPSLPALCRTSRPEVAANMASFGIRHTIDPYETFGASFALAIRSAGSGQLTEWLTGVPGTELAAQQEPPRGAWVVCGQDRFGRVVIRSALEAGLAVTVTSPKQGGLPPGVRWVPGIGTQADTLREAGIDKAAGLVAGTGDDVDNLSIVVTARALNTGLFVVLRQNRAANHELFQALKADMTMVPSEIIAHECLAILNTPLLSCFLNLVKQRDDAWADAVIARLAEELGREVPATWQVRVDKAHAPALLPAINSTPVPLDVLRRDPADCEARLVCVPLLAIRRGQATELPPWDWVIAPDDQFLFAGTPGAGQEQAAILRNPAIADYVLTGRELGNSWLWRKIAEARRTD